MYKKVSSDLNFVDREKQTVEFWKEHKIFEKSIEERKGDDTYTFYDGPPTANGKPHVGHVLSRVIKDMIPRYQTMKGHKIIRKAGWDTHGLPVELEVEKKLGLDGKEQIEEYGLAPFIKECKESVWKYKGMWEDFSGVVGFWADMDDPYVTYHNDYIESVWWALKQIWDKGLLYKGYKIVPYCPRCGTPLSSHEVAQGYKDVKEKSAIARFKVKGEDAYILAWTTTPWTLPSNVALCVNPNETYVKVENDGYTYYLAEALCDSVLEGEYKVLKTYKGTDLEYKEYEPLFSFVTPKEKAYYVTCDTYVTLTDGTGVVHIAPAFGEDDAQVGRKYGLPFVQLVDEKGEMTKETPWAGTFCKEADKLILKELEEKGLLFAALDFEHSYPHCWRCDTPLIYYARESWFIKMTDVKDQLIKNNNTVNWIPENIGKGRFGDWLENVQDWGISRNRYWGTPLNVWECECGHQHAIGSIEELKSMSDNCPDDIELHRPYIDDVTVKCPECGKEMHRVEEVIDCWFDSGSMPFAQWHYPFENKEIFEENFPADFISEAVDQTRGWFYSLLAISTLLFDKAPYKNVIVLGHVLDENGQKMSKSKGNAVDPMEAEMSNWYVRRCRERFWAKGMEQDKINAYMTLYTALTTVCKAAAPMIPFMTEEIYQNLVKSVDQEAPESIHLCDFPAVDESLCDKELEENMDAVLKIVVLGRACRNSASIKNRQPIGQMYVKAPSELPEFYQDIIREELNVKAIEFTDDVSNFTTYNFKPQLKTVGPKYGKLLNGIRKHLTELDGNKAKAELDSKGMLEFTVDGMPVELSEEDLLIEMVKQEGFVTEADSEFTVVLDTNLTEELLEEGFVREIISKVQSMRKEAGFEVMDKITIFYEANEKVNELISKNESTVMNDVLATGIVSGEAAGFTKEWNINGEKVTLGVKKNEE